MKRSPTYFSGIHVSLFSGVLLVLLFLFMIIPQPRYEDAVDLPKSHYIELQPHALREDAISVVITRDGRYFFHKEVLPQELPKLILDAVRQGSERRVYISADARTSYADVKAVVSQ